MIDSPGLYPDIPELTYHADNNLAPELGRSLSSSGAKAILDCPARFVWLRDHPIVKAEYDFGHVAHARLLGRGQDIVVVEADSWRTSDAKQQRTDAYTAGKVPILAADSAKADALVAAVRQHPVAAAIFAEGQPEQSLYWIDQDTGVTCRGRLDWLHERAIVDFKTTAGGGAAPRKFARNLVDYGYALQAAWYSEGCEAVTGVRLPFIHVVAEKEPPYLVSVFQVDQDALDYGAEAAAYARITYAECESTGEWPAYTRDVELVSLPGWALQRGPTA